MISSPGGAQRALAGAASTTGTANKPASMASTTRVFVILLPVCVCPSDSVPVVLSVLGGKCSICSISGVTQTSCSRSCTRVYDDQPDRLHRALPCRHDPEYEVA